VPTTAQVGGDEKTGLMGGPGPGGQLLRRLIPFLAVALPAMGLVRYEAQRTGIASTAVASVSSALVLLLAAIAMVWWVARRLDRADAEGRRGLARLEDQNRQLAEAQSIGRLGSWEHDMRTGQRRYSDELLRIWGRDPADGPPPPDWFLEHVVEEDRERVDEAIVKGVQEWQPFEVEYAVRHESGMRRIVHVRGRPVEGPDGARLRMTGTTQDVTRQRAAEMARAEAEELFRRAFEDAPIGMTITALDGSYMRVNRELAAILGYPRDELLAMTYGDLVHPDDLPRDQEAVRAMLAGERPAYTTEKRYIHAEGHVIWVHFHASLVRDAEGEPAYFLTHSQDITDRREYERELRHLADHDPLTGLLNRRALEREVRDHMARAERYGPEGALLMVDMDNFKTVNDTLGHVAGDDLMVRVARRLRGCLRDSDVLARLGGDEFAVLLPQANLASARMVARKLCEAVRSEGRETPGIGPAPVTASVGGAPVAGPDGSVLGAEQLMHAADRAMYRAKAKGRDGIVLLDAAEVKATPGVGQARRAQDSV
jgi:diguanylate cyclase (GGDEF)-like protein/PAS domain S-box-containing protein